ncbi:hypothetical protein DFH27DRAFT_657220 [Peziza echinospora]|nr:hypothetical protein DFH27DRAFT_657220 [Peziza echinospora]
MSSTLPQIPTPKFDLSVIQAERTDGYWVETFFIDRKDKFPSLIAYGLVTGEICVFDNPRNTHPTPIGPDDPEPPWKRYLIANLNSPVAVCPADCAGNGQRDILITHDYGATFLDTDPKGGLLSWLENPGRREDGGVHEDWKRRFIGRWPSMHRLQAGRFTQRAFLEIVALPITHGPFDIETPIPIFLYTRDAKSLDNVEWKTSVIDDNYFTLIHECTLKSFEGHEGLQSMLIASREGVNLLYYDTPTQSWKRELINPGMPKEPGKDYYGCACVNAARVGNDPAAFMMTVDPFHGGTVTALTKRGTGPGTYEWVRHVLDVYGDPKQRLDKGDGPGHHIAVGDFDGDGDEECLVALFGPNPGKGVYYYKALDLDRGIFAKWKVADESAARIAVGHFTGNPTLDFATIGYNVPKYYEEKHPQLNLYKHSFPLRATPATAAGQIIATIWDGEPLYHLPLPTKISSPITLDILNISGYLVSVKIYPAGFTEEDISRNVVAGEGIKVLYGQVKVGGKKYASPVTGNSPKDFSRDIRLPDVNSSDGSKLPFVVGPTGAVILRFKPLNGAAYTTASSGRYPTAQSVIVQSLFAPTYPTLQLPSVAGGPGHGVGVKEVSTEEWEGDDVDLEGVHAEAIRTKGFSKFLGASARFRFLDGVGRVGYEQKEICGVDFYAIAGGGTSGTKSYASTTSLTTHLCLSNGTGGGAGILALRAGASVLSASSFDKIPLGPLRETTGLWERGKDGKAVVKEDGSFVHPDWKWQSGDGGNGVDVWAAFEFNPKLVG